MPGPRDRSRAVVRIACRFADVPATRGSLFALCLAAALGGRAVRAQPVLTPSAAAPFRQKLDLTIPDAQFRLVPAPRVAGAAGPFRFRFRHPALDSLLAAPGTLQYVVFDDGAFHLQLLHVRPAILPADALGPQAFELVDAMGAVVGHGALLVVTRVPEPLGASTLEAGRVLPLGQATAVRLEVRTHGNYAGQPELLNDTEYEWTAGATSEGRDSAGTVTIEGTLRPLRRDAKPPRLAVRTHDGRSVELAFAGLAVRAAAPRPVAVTGGPIFLDAVGTGGGAVVVTLPDAGDAAPDVATATAELTVRDLRYDRAARRLGVVLEFAARSPRPAGTREMHDLTITLGAREYRGRVEVVSAATVALVGTDQGAGTRAVVTLGAGPTLLRVAGQNLDDMRLDCAPLGPGASCRTVSATAGELVTQVSPGAATREGEFLLPLVAEGRRPRGGATPGGVRVLVERPAVPVALSGTPLLGLECGRVACRRGRDAGSIVVRARDVRELALVVTDSLIPVANGWQRLVATVTRVRGDQRQVIRTFGSTGAPRALRHGLRSPAMPLVDVAADLRHGDVLLVRVEHALEQYPAASRGAPEALEPYLRSVYVDGGPLTRLAADVSVQPVLYSVARDTGTAAIEPLYMNAGIGVTWQPMNWRMQPRLASAKLQLIGTSLVDDRGDRGARQPVLFASGNLRVPGTDPGRPVVLTGGVARLLTGQTGWRLLAGAGVDLGLSRLMLGR